MHASMKGKQARAGCWGSHLGGRAAPLCPPAGTRMPGAATVPRRRKAQERECERRIGAARGCSKDGAFERTSTPALANRLTHSGFAPPIAAGLGPPIAMHLLGPAGLSKQWPVRVDEHARARRWHRVGGCLEYCMHLCKARRARRSIQDGVRSACRHRGVDGDSAWMWSDHRTPERAVCALGFGPAIEWETHVALACETRLQPPTVAISGGKNPEPHQIRPAAPGCTRGRRSAAPCWPRSRRCRQPSRPPPLPPPGRRTPSPRGHPRPRSSRRWPVRSPKSGAGH
jgi:hypothetical protein